MSRWFRFYEGALDDPKVQTLPPDDFKGWVNVLCVASRNDGVIPSTQALAFALRMELDACQTLVERLVNAGLIDTKSGGPNGSHHAPHGWDKRQYKSDNSTARVKRFRERSETVAETPPDTEQIQSRTETEKKGREGAQTDLAFVGKIIRLKVSDYARWAAAYDAIPDLRAELTKADDYYSQNTPERGWYFAVSAWLKRAHDEALKGKRDPDEMIYRNVL